MTARGPLETEGQERRRKRRIRRRRLSGCISLVLLVIFITLGWFVYTERSALFSDGRFHFRELANRLLSKGERLRAKSEKLRETPPGDLLEQLRGKVADIQARSEEYVASLEMREFLESLRDDLEKKRDGAAGAVGDHWDDLIDRGEKILEKAQASEAWEAGKELPREFKEALELLRQFRDAEKEVEESVELEKENGKE